MYVLRSFQLFLTAAPGVDLRRRFLPPGDGVPSPGALVGAAAGLRIKSNLRNLRYFLWRAHSRRDPRQINLQITLRVSAPANL